MAASNVIPIRAVRESVESYEGKRPTALRERLTPTESALVRYVFTDWASDAGARSIWSITVESAAKRAVGGDGKRVGAEIDATMHVSQSHSLGLGDLWPQERWCAQQRARKDQIIRCWRALKDVHECRPMALVVLHRLFGDRPPGDRGVNPFVDQYPRDVATDYALVAELAGGESWGEWCALVRGLKSDRPARLAAISTRARATERLIGDAVRLYRDCWQDVSEPRRIRAAAGAMQPLVVREEVPVGVMGPLKP